VLWLTVVVAFAAALHHYAGARRAALLLVGLSVLASVGGYSVGRTPLGKRLTTMACALLVLGLMAASFSN
jgi:hypothetical protein